MLTIMVVDDDVSSVTLLTKLLVKYDFIGRIYPFTNPGQALVAVGDIRPDVLITDIEMPGMSGMELAERVLDLNPRTKIVFVTAYEFYAIEAFEMYALDYIVKPIRADRLNKTVARLAEQFALRSQPAPSAAPLTVCALGRLELRKESKLIRWQGAKTEELFAFLLSHYDQNVHKDYIVDVLWPDFDYKRALRNMQTAMCRVRQSFQELGAQARIVYSSNHYRLLFDPPFHYDVLDFENRVSALNDIRESNAGRALSALAVYTGDFLEYNGYLWALAKQQSLRQRYLDLLRKCAVYYSNAGIGPAHLLEKIRFKNPGNPLFQANSIWDAFV